MKGLGTCLLKLGIHSEHDTEDCCGGPGIKGFADQDASFYKVNGIEYLKVDSCKGHNANVTQMYTNFITQRYPNQVEKQFFHLRKDLLYGGLLRGR